MYIRHFSETRIEHHSHADADDADDAGAGDAVEHSLCPAFGLCSLQTQPDLILLTTLCKIDYYPSCTENKAKAQRN